MKNLNLTIIIVAILVVLGFLIGIFMIKGTSQTLTATGNYQMSVMPDEALVYLTIETRSTSADQAKNDNALISQKVLDSLSSLIDSKSIETENYNIYPEYDWNNGKQTLKGYVASNNIKIKINDFSIIGKVIDSSVDSGALVSYINFELSTAKNNEYKSIALAEASKDAKKKAESIATGLGKKLGSLVSVSSSDYNYMPYPLYRAESSDVAVKQVATNIQPRSLDISATVNVVYNLK